MIESTIIHNLKADQILNLFEEVKICLIDLNKKIEPNLSTEYLTPKEVAAKLKCDLSTVYNWTKKGKLSRYGIGNRTYYKRHEVELAIVKYD